MERESERAPDSQREREKNVRERERIGKGSEKEKKTNRLKVIKKAT